MEDDMREYINNQISKQMQDWNLKNLEELKELKTFFENNDQMLEQVYQQIKTKTEETKIRIQI